MEAGKARNSTNSQRMCTERLKMMKKKLKTAGLTSERSSRVKKTQPKRFRLFQTKRIEASLIFKVLFHMYKASN